MSIARILTLREDVEPDKTKFLDSASGYQVLPIVLFPALKIDVTILQACVVSGVSVRAQESAALVGGLLLSRGLLLLRVSSRMDKTIARLNIAHCRKRLASETDQAKRRTLLRLLAEEEAKLAWRQPPEDPGRHAAEFWC